MTDKDMRGLIISNLGKVYGTAMRIRCDCGHRGVAFYNFLTDMAAWACGKCGAHVTLKNVMKEAA